MKNWVSKQTKSTWLILASVVLALIGFIIYLVTSTTGFLAGRGLDVSLVLLSIISMVVLLVLFVFRSKIKVFENALTIVGGILVAVSTCLFVYARISVAADVWFIPVNYPPEEATTLYTSIVGVVFYFLSFVCVFISSFGSATKKEVEVAAN